MQKRYYLQERHLRKPIPLFLMPFSSVIDLKKAEEEGLMTKWKDVVDMSHYKQKALLVFTIRQAKKVKICSHYARIAGLDGGASQEIRIMDVVTKQEVK